MENGGSCFDIMIDFGLLDAAFLSFPAEILRRFSILSVVVRRFDN